MATKKDKNKTTQEKHISQLYDYLSILTTANSVEDAEIAKLASQTIEDIAVSLREIVNRD